MFKNSYQAGFLSILYSIGSKPLQIWDKEGVCACLGAPLRSLPCCTTACCVQPHPALNARTPSGDLVSAQYAVWTLAGHAFGTPPHPVCHACIDPCSTVRNGHIKRLTDADIQSSVLEIMSANVSTTYITTPANPQETLGIKVWGR